MAFHVDTHKYLLFLFKCESSKKREERYFILDIEVYAENKSNVSNLFGYNFLKTTKEESPYPTLVLMEVHYVF